MFLKFFGQLVLTATVAQLVPVDAGQLEYLAFGESFMPTSYAYEGKFQLPSAGDRELPDYPRKVDQDSFGVVTSARSTVVQDAESGMILLAEAPYEVRSIGSVTKLMTALVFMEQVEDLDVYEPILPEDVVYGGRIYLLFNDPIRLEDMLGASLVGSDNTATKSLVRYSGLSYDDFIARMNEKAREIGMEDTTFTDPTGIDATNVATATDLVQLLKAAESHPEMKKFMQSSQIVVRQQSGIAVTIENTNALLTGFLNEDPYEVEAGKTGYLPQAGYVLATTVSKDDVPIHVVVMGSDTKDTRVTDAKGLAAWAFSVFSWPE